jgi:hypothetical protein
MALRWVPHCPLVCYYWPLSQLVVLEGLIGRLSCPWRGQLPINWVDDYQATGEAEEQTCNREWLTMQVA